MELGTKYSWLITLFPSASNFTIVFIFGEFVKNETKINERFDYICLPFVYFSFISIHHSFSSEHSVIAFIAVNAAPIKLILYNTCNSVLK